MKRSNMDKVLRELEGQSDETLSRVAERLEALVAEASAPRQSPRGQSQQRAVLDDQASAQVCDEV